MVAKRGLLGIGFFLLGLIPGLLLAQGSPADSTLSSIQISARVEKTKVPLNRTLLLHITLSWQGTPDLYEIESFDNPALTNFEIVGTATANRSEVRDGKPWVFRDYTYTLKPRELGMGYVEGVVVRCRNTSLDKEESLVTQRIPVEVVDPVPEPGAGPSPWAIVLPILAVVVVGAGGVVVWRRRQARLQQEEEVPPPPIEVTYLEELGREVNVQQPDLQADFDRLSKLLRRYLAEKYGIRAREATTAELRELLTETGLEEHRIASIQEMLTRCDEIKFSGTQGTPEELSRYYTLVESLLEAGKGQAPEPADEGEKS